MCGEYGGLPGGSCGVLLAANSVVRAVAGVELLVYADDVDAGYLVIGVGDGVAERVESGTGVAGYAGERSSCSRSACCVVAREAELVHQGVIGCCRIPGIPGANGLSLIADQSGIAVTQVNLVVGHVVGGVDDDCGADFLPSRWQTAQSELLTARPVTWCDRLVNSPVMARTPLLS